MLSLLPTGVPVLHLHFQRWLRSFVTSNLIFSWFSISCFLSWKSLKNVSHNRAQKDKNDSKNMQLTSHQLLGITGITGKLHDNFSPYWVHFNIIGSKTVRGATFYLPRSYWSPYGHSAHVCARDTQKCVNCKHVVYFSCGWYDTAFKYVI